MKTTALFSIKGGVGKTAASVNLAHLAARGGARTLLWDLDPQGAATFYLRVRPKLAGGSKRLSKRKTLPRGATPGSDFRGLTVIPADFALAQSLCWSLNRTLDNRLARLRSPAPAACETHRPGLRRTVRPVCRWCSRPRSCEASDLVAVPTIPTTLSLRTYAQLVAPCESETGSMPRSCPLPMADRRRAACTATSC